MSEWGSEGGAGGRTSAEWVAGSHPINCAIDAIAALDGLSGAIEWEERRAAGADSRPTDSGEGCLLPLASTGSVHLQTALYTHKDHGEQAHTGRRPWSVPIPSTSPQQTSAATRDPSLPSLRPHRGARTACSRATEPCSAPSSDQDVRAATTVPSRRLLSHDGISLGIVFPHSRAIDP